MFTHKCLNFSFLASGKWVMISAQISITQAARFTPVVTALHFFRFLLSSFVMPNVGNLHKNYLVNALLRYTVINYRQPSLYQEL